MKTNIICAIATSILFLGCADTKQKLGYESENGSEVDIYVGNVESTEIIRKWFDSYNARDLETVSSIEHDDVCLLYTSPSPRDRTRSRMPSSA